MRKRLSITIGIFLGLLFCSSLWSQCPSPPDVELDPNDQNASKAGDTIILCEGYRTLNLRNNDAAGGTSFSLSVDWGDGTPSSLFGGNLRVLTHNYANEGFYTVSVRSLNASLGPCPQPNTTTLKVYVGRRPTADISALDPLNVCAPDQIRFSIAGINRNNSPGTQYIVLVSGEVVESFSQEELLSGAFDVIAIDFNETSCGREASGEQNAFDFQLVAANPCGRDVVIRAPILVSEQPDADFSITPPDLPCTDECWRFDDASFVAEVRQGSGGDNICLDKLPQTWTVRPGVEGVDWELCDGKLTNSEFIEVRFLKPGNYEVGLSITSINCNVTSEIFKPLPPIQETPVASVTPQVQGTCVPVTVQYINNSTGDFSSANWNIRRLTTGGSPVPPTINPDSPNPGDYTVTFNSWGQYEVSLTLVGDCGASVWRDTILIADKPLADIFNLPNVCDNVVLEFGEGTKGFSERGSPITGYLWNFNPDGIPLTSTERDPTARFPNPGPKEIRLTATNACGDGVDVETFFVVPTPTLTLPPPTEFCINDAAFTFQASASEEGSGVWSGPGITPDGAFDPTSVAPGVYQLTYTFTPALAPCVVKDSFPVEVFDLPEIVFDNPPEKVCRSVETLPIGLLPPTPAGGTWSVSDGGQISPEGVFLPSASGLGLFEVSYETLPDPLTGCIRTESFPIQVVDLPNVTAEDASACDTRIPVRLVGSPSVGGVGVWRDDGSGRIIDPDAGLFDASGGEGQTFTVFYQFTDENGCVGEDTATVRVDPPPPVNAGPDTNLCISVPSYDLSTQVFTPGGVWSEAPGLVGDRFFPPVAGPGVSTLIYTITIGPENCSSSDTVFITVNDRPAINFLTPSQICESVDTLQLLANPAGGTWRPLDGGIVVNGSQFLPGESGPNAYRFSYETLPDNNGCENIGTFSIRVDPLPTVTAPDQTICEQPTPLFGANPQPGLWSGPGITDPATGLFDPAEAALITGSPPPYPVEFTHQDPTSGCINSDVASIDVIPVPVVDPGPNQTLCIDGGLDTLAGFSPAGGSWSGPGITDPVGIFDPTLGEGDYVIEYAYSPPGAIDCEVVASKVIRVIDLTGTDAGPDTALCQLDAPLDLVGSPAGGSFNGSGVVGTVAEGFQFDPSLAGEGEQLITYTFEQEGCSFSDERTLLVNPIPGSNFESDTLACVNIDRVQFANTSVLQDPTVSARWDFGDGSTSGELNPEYTYTREGVFRVSLTMTTQEGCQDSIQKAIVVEGPPVADFSFVPATICAQSNPVVFTNNSSGFRNSYEWDFGNGAFSSLENPDPVIYPGGTKDTTYTAILLAQNLCGNDVQEQTLFVRPFPDARFTVFPDSGCSPFDATFTNLSTPDNAGTSYEWDFGNGRFSLDRNPAPVRYETLDDRDSVFVTLITRNICGIDTARQLVKVDPPDVVPRFAIPNPTGCIPHTVSITNQAFPPSADIFWDWGDGNSLAEPDPGSYTYEQPGTYIIQQTVTNSCGSAAINQLIVVNDLPSVSLSFADNPCALDSVQFTTPSGPYTYRWDFGDGSFSSLKDPVHVYESGGAYAVSLTLRDTVNGCLNTLSRTINVRPVPTVAFTLDNGVGCEPVSIDFTNETPGDDLFFTWDFGDGNSSAERDPTHVFEQAGSYTVRLIAIDALGCDDEQTFSPTHSHPKPDGRFRSYRRSGMRASGGGAVHQSEYGCRRLSVAVRRRDL